MRPDRRRVLQSIGVAMLAPRLALAQKTELKSASASLIRLNLPGPGSLPFMPLELIPALGFDQELGARLLLRYHPSGIHAIEDMLLGNADFSALGFPTLPLLQAKGKDVVAIAPLSGVEHTFHMIVRKDLAKQITRLQDLKGHTIGVSIGSINSKTYMQMLTELLLDGHGVPPGQIRWLGTGQNWESLSGALISKAADAVLCEQPFPQRLIRSGLGVSIADLSDSRVQSRIAGIDALRSVVATNQTLLGQAEGQHKADLFVRILRRTLVWLQTTPPETVTRHAVAQNDAERGEIVAILRKSPRIYSPDARFVTRQIDATNVFLRAMQSKLKLPPASSCIDDRWAGKTA